MQGTLRLISSRTIFSLLFTFIWLHLCWQELAYHIASRQLTKAENLNPLKIFSNAWSIGWLQTMNSYTFRQSKQIEWLIEFMCHNFPTPSKTVIREKPQTLTPTFFNLTSIMALAMQRQIIKAGVRVRGISDCKDSNQWYKYNAVWCFLFCELIG